MTATTATSPLKIQREEMTSNQSSSDPSARGGGGGGFDLMSVRKLAESERRASFGGTQSIPGSGRTGAQLPAIPPEGGSRVAMNEKGFVWNRSGSLSEQAFIEQINEMRGMSPTPGRNDQQMRFADDSLNFEIDDEYEREGENVLIEDDEDDLDVRRQKMSEAGEVYTIPEESEEESPKVEINEEKMNEPDAGNPRGLLSLRTNLVPRLLELLEVYHLFELCPLVQLVCLTIIVLVFEIDHMSFLDTFSSI